MKRNENINEKIVSVMLITLMLTTHFMVPMYVSGEDIGSNGKIEPYIESDNETLEFVDLDNTESDPLSNMYDVDQFNPLFHGRTQYGGLTLQASPVTGGNPTSSMSAVIVLETTTLSANPSTGYRFIRWEIVSGDGDFRNGNANSPNTDFTMASRTATVRAVYERIPAHSLTLQASPTTGGNPTAGSASLLPGDTTTLTASPATGYRFVRWEIVSGTGSSLSSTTSASTTFTMGSGNATVRAVYGIPHSLTLQASPTTGGNPTAGSASLLPGDTTTLTANPATGYRFVRWEIVSGTGSSLSSTTSASTTFMMGSGNATVRAVYEQIPHSLALEASPTTGGNPTAGSASLIPGDTTTLTANPATGYRFALWEIVSGTGSSLSSTTSASTTFTMGSGNATVRAVYERIPHSLTLQANPTTGGNPTAGSSSLIPGDTTTLTANPSTGYRFALWEIVSGTGSSLSSTTSASTTFTMGSGNATVLAVYEPVFEINTKVLQTPLGTSIENVNLNHFIESVELGGIELTDYTVELMGSFDAYSIGEKQTTIKVSVDEFSTEISVSYQVNWGHTIGFRATDGTGTHFNEFTSSLSLLPTESNPIIVPGFGEQSVRTNRVGTRPIIQFYRQDETNNLLDSPLVLRTFTDSMQIMINQWNDGLSGIVFDYGDVARFNTSTIGNPVTNELGRNVFSSRNNEMVVETQNFPNAYYMLTRDGYHLLRMNQLTTKNGLSVPVGIKEEEMNELAETFFTYDEQFSEEEKGQFSFEFVRYDSTDTIGINKTGSIAVTQTIPGYSTFTINYDVLFSVIPPTNPDNWIAVTVPERIALVSNGSATPSHTELMEVAHRVENRSVHAVTVSAEDFDLDASLVTNHFNTLGLIADATTVDLIDDHTLLDLQRTAIFTLNGIYQNGLGNVEGGTVENNFNFTGTLVPPRTGIVVNEIDGGSITLHFRSHGPYSED